MISIVGGRVVTATGVEQADVVIRDGKVVDLAVSGSGAGARVDARVDADGCFVLPGGVDPHSHIMSDIAAAASAAALGGTTTVLSFTNPDPGEGALEGLLRRRGEISQAQPAVDIGLHAMIYDLERASFEELAAIRDAGAAGIKVFLAYSELGIMCSTRRLYELMTWTRKLGLLMQVHCENGSLIDALVEEAVRSGRRGPSAFTATRPAEVEQEAVARTLAAAALAGAQAYLVHLSCARALGQVRMARSRPRPQVFAEACLHHLLLDESHAGACDGDRFLVCPPLRDATEREAIWEGIVDGTIDTVGSDHVQRRSLIPEELRADGASAGYGLAGVGPRLPLFLSEGLARGVAIARLVELSSTAPAQIFGHPDKGVIAPGSDADLVVWSPEGSSTLGVDTYDDGTGDSVYSGWQVNGSIRAVLLRGRLIAQDGRLVDSGQGRYLPTRAWDAASRDTVRR